MDRLRVGLRWRRAVGYFSRLTENRQSREPDADARDCGDCSDMVARWALSGVRGEAEDLRGRGDRYLRHGDARGETSHDEHSSGQTQCESHLVEGWDVHRLYAGAGEGNEFQHLHRGGGDLPK